jgi:hypothetical protein
VIGSGLVCGLGAGIVLGVASAVDLIGVVVGSGGGC